MSAYMRDGIVFSGRCAHGHDRNIVSCPECQLIERQLEREDKFIATLDRLADVLEQIAHPVVMLEMPEDKA